MPANARRFYLARHGITTWNALGRFQGHSDTPLSAEGREQAQRLGARLAADPHPPQSVWSSDLERARETAEAIAAPLGLTVRTTPLLREQKFGEWEGLTRVEIEARGDGALLERLRGDERMTLRPPGGETMNEVWERLLCFDADILSQETVATVAVVGHTGSLRALLCEALDAPRLCWRRLTLDNASLSLIEQSGDGASRQRWLRLFNETSHLK